MKKKILSEKELAIFFDERSINRDTRIRAHPCLEYEQRMRRDAVFELLKPKKENSILDIGCGNLRDCRLLAQRGIKVWGIDISWRMLKEGIKLTHSEVLTNMTVLVASATHMPFHDGCFDKIICSEVIEHIPQYELCIEEMARCLRKGGTLVITTPNKRSLYGLDRKLIEFLNILLGRRPWPHPYDKWKTEDEVTALLQKHGLKIRNKIGICFLLGFSFSGVLPLKVVALIIKLIQPIEKRMRLKLHGYGYMIGISATK